MGKRAVSGEGRAKPHVDRMKGSVDPAGCMRHLTVIGSLVGLLVFCGLPLEGKEKAEGECEPVLLVGGLLAYVSDERVEYWNLPSEKILRVDAEGVRSLDAAEVGEIHPSVPRLHSKSVGILPDPCGEAVDRRLRVSFDEILVAFEDGGVSRDDAIAVGRFLVHGVGIEFEEGFRSEVARRLTSER